MFKLFPSRQDIILKRIEALTIQINKCTDNNHFLAYNRCINRIWKLYGLDRKRK